MKYIIKSQMGYLESHCAALVWKPLIKNAKQFKSIAEAKRTQIKWNILNTEIQPI